MALYAYSYNIVPCRNNQQSQGSLYRRPVGIDLDYAATLERGTHIEAHFFTSSSPRRGISQVDLSRPCTASCISATWARYNSDWVRRRRYLPLHTEPQPYRCIAPSFAEKPRGHLPQSAHIESTWKVEMRGLIGPTRSLHVYPAAAGNRDVRLSLTQRIVSCAVSMARNVHFLMAEQKGHPKRGVRRRLPQCYHLHH
jgi:hypothetical protein